MHCSKIKILKWQNQIKVKGKLMLREIHEQKFCQAYIKHLIAILSFYITYIFLFVSNRPHNAILCNYKP